jgi:putative transcriptional regulator
MSKKYRSDAMAAIHETMDGLHGIGAIDKQTMRRFDDACLTPIRPLEPAEINPGEGTRQPNCFRQLPERDQQFGEQVGARRKAPFRAALKLLSLVEKNGLATVA